jgi:hypothetical protein
MTTCGILDSSAATSTMRPARPQGAGKRASSDPERSRRDPRANRAQALAERPTGRDQATNARLRFTAAGSEVAPRQGLRPSPIALPRRTEPSSSQPIRTLKLVNPTMLIARPPEKSSDARRRCSGSPNRHSRGPCPRSRDEQKLGEGEARRCPEGATSALLGLGKLLVTSRDGREDFRETREAES